MIRLYTTNELSRFTRQQLEHLRVELEQLLLETPPTDANYETICTSLANIRFVMNRFCKGPHL